MSVRILGGDVFERLAQLPDESVHCVVTSPPYWGLRAYGEDEKMIGLEETFEEHMDVLVRVFREVQRVLRSDGTCWLNYGDAYAGSWGAQSRGNACVETSSLSGGQVYAAPKGTHTGSTKRTGLKPKDLMMMPARLALALQSDGWWLRSEIVWSKPNPMPESVTDRPTSAHEKVFLLTKSAKYFYNAEAVRKPVQVLETRGFRPGVYGGAPPGNPRKTDKQRGHSRRHAGFNGRWDEMSKAEQEAMGANLRNVWTISTFGYPEAHFATFPPALVEPCIKAGTSEEGCCAVCGSPFEQLTERSYRNHGNRTTNGPRSVERRDETAGFNRRLEAVHSSLGWQPNCVCDAGDPAPAVVLDPFAGAGTVGLVAARLGRNAILIELNLEYAEMARRRIHEDAPLFADVKADSVPKESHETAQLFAD